MKNKNFYAQIVTRAGVVWESFPKKTFGGAERWIKRLIEDDCPSIPHQEIFAIKIFHKRSQTFWAGHYNTTKKKLEIWCFYYRGARWTVTTLKKEKV